MNWLTTLAHCGTHEHAYFSWRHLMAAVAIGAVIVGIGLLLARRPVQPHRHDRDHNDQP